MTNPPRRSRPAKPAQTIDLTAAAAKPLDSPAAPARAGAEGDLGDPEMHIGDKASERRTPEDEAAAAAPAETPQGLSVLGEPEAGDRNAPTDNAFAATQAVESTSVTDPGAPAAAGEGVPRDTAEAEFAADESLRAQPNEGEREEIDAETILAAAEPHPAAPAAPAYDYTAPPSTHGDHGPGFGSLLGAALLGAVIALGAGGALQYAGVLPAVRTEDTTQLTQQFARTGDVQQLSTDLNTVRNDVAQLQSALAAGGAGSGASATELAALTDRVAQLEQRAGAAQAQGQAPAADPAALQGVTDAANQARDTANQARDTANQAREAAEAATNTANAARQGADEARQTATTAQQAAGTAQQAADVAQQAARGAMDTANSNGEALKAVDGRIAAVEAANRQAAVAIAAANLKAAIDRGGPFMGELESYATTAGQNGAVDTLRGFAAAGVPTAEQLQTEWPDVRQAILRALRPNDPNAGVGEQILSGLSSLVTVRPSGSGGGGTSAAGAEGTIARLDAALQRGDFAAFAQEWQGLPQAGQDAGAGFIAKVRARADTDRVLADTLNQAVKTIGKAG